MSVLLLWICRANRQTHNKINTATYRLKWLRVQRGSILSQWSSSWNCILRVRRDSFVKTIYCTSCWLIGKRDKLYQVVYFVVVWWMIYSECILQITVSAVHSRVYWTRKYAIILWFVTGTVDWKIMIWLSLEVNIKVLRFIVWTCHYLD